MSFDVLGDLNWLAVIVAALAYFALGALWYAPPTFGTAWTKSMGWERSESDPAPGPEIYVGPLITTLITSVALAMLAAATGSDSAAEGLVLGLVVGVGISGSVLLLTGVFDPTKRQPLVWFAITAGYHLLGLLIASVIVSIWR